MKFKGIIHLRKMEFYAYHGVLPEEKVLGQKFLVDVDIYLPDLPNQEEHGLIPTVDYSRVYQTVKECVENERFNLIEVLADTIATRILAEYTCLKVRVEVHKPQAPIPGIIADVSAEVIREK
ncbi:MAG: dihydroneopterin aldolase [Peptococcaceae bacterium]|jgi:dihydroneopterin aldolase|nr:dihydroneopterin aldolase [Peptococcaceae bacterium]